MSPANLLWLALAAWHALAASAAPSRAGATLKVAVPNPIDHTDPIKMRSAQETFVLPLIYEHLFLGNSDGNLSPELAESWTVDPKTARLLVRLKAGHFFSDGSEVRAADVVRSIARFCDPQYKTSGRLIGLKGCGPTSSGALGVGAQDDRTVYFELSVHPSAFLYQLAFGAAVVMKEVEKDTWAGSGPYRIDKLKEGRLVLVKNAFCTQSKNEGVDKIEFEFVPESELAGKLKTGEFDVASMYMYPSIVSMDLPAYRVYKHAAQVTQTLVLNPKVHPFTRIAVRKALAKGIEHSKIFECRPGQGRANGLIPKGLGGSLPAGAEGLKDSDDIPESFWASARLKSPVVARVYRSSERKNACEEDIIKAVFARLNITLEMIHLDSYKQLIPKYLDPSTNAYIEYFVFTSRDASSILGKLSPATKEPYFFYTAPKFEKQIAIALREGSIAKRFSIYRELSREIQDYAGVIPLYYVPHTNVVKKTLVGESSGNMIFNPNSFLFLLQMSPRATSL